MSDPHPAHSGRPPEREDKRSFLQKVAEFIHPGPDSTEELIETLAEAEDNEVIGADTLGYLSNEHVVQLAKNAKCGFCTACFTGEYAVKPEEVLSTDIHERHLNDRPKDEKKLGE